MADQDARKSTEAETTRERGAHLPHDRDEKAAPEAQNAQHHENRGIIRQAKQDIDAGIQDTERIGTPNDVPTGGKDR